MYTLYIVPTLPSISCYMLEKAAIFYVPSPDGMYTVLVETWSECG